MDNFFPLDISLHINRLIIFLQPHTGSVRENFYLTREFYKLCISRHLNTWRINPLINH